MSAHLKDPSRVGDKISLEEIHAFLPHRRPKLFIDSAEVLTDRHPVEILGLYCVRAEDCEGHFPGHPVFPGINWIEMANQVAAVGAAHLLGHSVEGALVSIKKTQFRWPAFPDAQLSMAVRLLRCAEGQPLVFDAVGYVSGRTDPTLGYIDPAFQSERQICFPVSLAELSPQHST